MTIVGWMMPQFCAFGEYMMVHTKVMYNKPSSSMLYQVVALKSDEGINVCVPDREEFYSALLLEYQGFCYYALMPHQEKKNLRASVETSD